MAGNSPAIAPIASAAHSPPAQGLRPVEMMAISADKITAGDLTSRVRPEDPATEVGRLGTALNGMLTPIEAAVREREASEEATRRFFADASHELRTPLASLRANAELYQQGALTHRSQEARRMGGLVDDMLRLAPALVEKSTPVRRLMSRFSPDI
jgi:two-component system, OmpR family, sensor kinase